MRGLPDWTYSLFALPARAQHTAPGGESTLHTEAVGPMRFVAVHGRRSVVIGYPAAELELWGYPFQILSGYQVGFKPRGTSVEVSERLLLRRIDYERDSITQIYIGPDYLVHGRIFVPHNDAATVICYERRGHKACGRRYSFPACFGSLCGQRLLEASTRVDRKCPRIPDIGAGLWELGRGWIGGDGRA